MLVQDRTPDVTAAFLLNSRTHATSRISDTILFHFAAEQNLTSLDMWRKDFPVHEFHKASVYLVFAVWLRFAELSCANWAFQALSGYSWFFDRKAPQACSSKTSIRVLEIFPNRKQLVQWDPGDCMHLFEHKKSGPQKQCCKLHVYHVLLYSHRILSWCNVLITQRSSYQTSSWSDQLLPHVVLN